MDGAILLIEHDMNFTLKIADRVIVVDEGRVIANGTSGEVKRGKRVKDIYFG